MDSEQKATVVPALSNSSGARVRASFEGPLLASGSPRDSTVPLDESSGSNSGKKRASFCCLISRKAPERDCAWSDERRQSLGVLSPMNDKDPRDEAGWGGMNPGGHGPPRKLRDGG